MNAKIGKCIDCPPGSPDKPITADRCQYHYWPYRTKVNSQKQAAKDKSEVKKDLNVFFASQSLIIPPNCENCDQPLDLSTSFNRRAVTAHILPKNPNSGFPSVSLHPQNRMFLGVYCGCHNSWDNKGSVDRKAMKVYPTAIERFNAFKSLLNQSELQKAKKYLGL